MSEQFDEQEKKEHKKKDDRIKLDKVNEIKVAKLKEQIENKFQGLFHVSTSYVGNFLIGQCSGEWSDKQLEQIREERLSDLQKARWLYERMKLAQSQGENLSFEELLVTLSPLGKIKKMKKEGLKKHLTNQEVEGETSEDDAPRNLAD